MKEKLKQLLKKLKDPLNITIFLIVYIIFFSPAWVGCLLYFITKHKLHLTYATCFITFWSMPFTPAIPIILVITFFIRRLYDKTKNSKSKNNKKNQDMI